MNYVGSIASAAWRTVQTMTAALRRTAKVTTKSDATNDVRAADVAVAYVSLVIPNTDRYYNQAVHYNGASYMREILAGLHRGGFSSVTALSARPMPAFPRGREVWVPIEQVEVDGAPVTFVPYVNVTPIKQIGIGVAVAVWLFVWAWRTRAIRKRVVLAFNLSVPPIAFVAVAARIARARLVAYVCDVNVPGHTVPDTALFRIDAWLQRQMLSQLDGLAVITDRIALDFAPGVDYLRLDVGLPREALKEVLSPIRPCENGSFVIAATGSLTGFNGFPEILKAFAGLSGDHYRLVIAGGGPLESDVRAAVAADGRIEYRGVLPYRELLRLHSQADVLVSLRITGALNTRYAFPSKTAEYFVSGVPVITTRTGHMAEEYDGCCVLLDGETPSDLTAAVRQVEAMTPSQRQDLGNRARSYMLNCKTWEAQTRRLVTYLVSVAGRPRAKRSDDPARRN